MLITLDYNCLISLVESQEPQATALRELISLCKREQIPVYLYSYAFLENPRRTGERLDLKKVLEAVGQGHIQTRSRDTIWCDDDGVASFEEELPFMQWVHHVMFPTIDSSWDTYLITQCAKLKIDYEEMLEANRDKQSLLFSLFSAAPKQATNPLSESLEPATKHHLRERWEKFHRKWNNAISDSQALCAHISWGVKEGIFVTKNTDDFQRNQEKLRKRIPALEIYNPEEVQDAVCKRLQNEPRKHGHLA